VQDHAAQLAALRAGVQDALADFRQRLQGIETLSLDVTQAALEKIFGDRALCAALVVQTARHHLSQVATGSAIGVRVSAMDFPQPEQLQEAFTSVTQHTRLTVHADPHLASGACLIQLTLGCLDVSLPQQLSHVTAAISTLYIGDPDEH
jgi:flagellar assembly protein FliH